MQNNLILYLMGGAGVLFIVIIVAYIMLSKKIKNSDVVQIRQLREGTKENKFSKEILYQKLYIRYLRSPFIKRYLFKIRRRLEIINIDDEYKTRKGTAQILTKALAILLPIIIITIIFTSSNYLYNDRW